MVCDSSATAKHSQADIGSGDPLAALRAIPALANVSVESDDDADSVRSGQKEHPYYLATAPQLSPIFEQSRGGPDPGHATPCRQAARHVHRGAGAYLQIPVELEKLFVVFDHPLPDREQLQHIAQELTSDHPEDLPQGENRHRLLDACAGLTRLEAKGALALSLARHNALRPECIWEIKAQMLAKSGLCSLYRGETKSFDSLKGVDHIRRLTSLLLRPDCPVPPKGWLFVGPPNGGKTSVAKAIAADNQLPLILADLPSLKAKFVGESESKVRRFIGLCEAMAPCCVLLDEIEDALAGATAESAGDSGVSRDQLSTILKWRSESKARVFLIATCNEPEKLLKVKQGRLFRDGRFDGIVFFDLPGRQAKDAMWHLYRKAHGIAPPSPIPRMRAGRRAISRSAASGRCSIKSRWRKRPAMFARRRRKTSTGCASGPVADA